METPIYEFDCMTALWQKDAKGNHWIFNAFALRAIEFAIVNDKMSGCSMVQGMQCRLKMFTFEDFVKLGQSTDDSGSQRCLWIA